MMRMGRWRLRSVLTTPVLETLRKAHYFGLGWPDKSNCVPAKCY
jgi:hypothetical protein